MKRDSELYQKYVETLKKELVPAMGCTEPIAISYAAARARDVLGCFPEKILVEASGNIIKNVKSVTVPNTDGMKGIEAAALTGAVAGKAEQKLEVISQVSQEQKERVRQLLDRDMVEVRVASSGLVFDLIVTVTAGQDRAVVRIVNEHTNIVYIEKNGEVLLERTVDCGGEGGGSRTEKDFMTVEDILDFARTCDLADVREVIGRQIRYNLAIAQEGLQNSWGACVGQTILACNDSSDVKIRVKAMAAAGSDARMSGCEMPVIINSGSGNQGITVSVPVIEYARTLGSSEEELYRALVLANLLSLHQKAGIGRLSAYCGAVSAGCAAGAGIAWLLHEDDSVIRHQVVNCLAITSGMICDGAKPSCAAKIAASLDSSLLALDMAKNGREFRGGEGIVKKGIENTIDCVGLLGREGMRETDREILKIMVER